MKNNKSITLFDWIISFFAAIGILFTIAIISWQIIKQHENYDLARNLIIEDSFCQSFSKEFAICKILQNDKNVLQILNDNEWKIIISDSKMIEIAETEGCSFASYVDEEKIIGFTKYDDKIIYVNSTWNSISQALNHEIGHALDFHFNMLSQKEEFETIFRNESHLMNKYHQKDKLEFFAEIYNYSTKFIHRKNKKFPKAMNYISTKIS